MKIIGANITGSFILNNQDVTNTVQSSSAWSGSVASQIDSLNAATASLYAVSASLNSATASLNAATSSLFNATASLFNATSSLNAATSSLNTASASFSSSIASLNTATASFSSSIGLLNGATASLNDATSSLNSATSSLNAATSSLSAATASLSAATASLNSSTASLSAATASLNSATSSLNAATSSLNTATASFSSSISSLNSFTSSQTALNNTFATTGSNNFVGNQVVSGSFTTSGSITATGTITAQTLVVQTITSSVDFVTGSTRFGSSLSNTHVFSGSVTMNPNGLFVSSSGNVGIGTSIPAEKLEVAGNIKLAVSGYVDNISSLKYAGYTWANYNTSTGAININNTTTNLTLSGGNVGIGTTSPSNKLDVVGGNVYFSTTNVNVVAKDTGTGYAVFVAQSQNAGGGILDVGAHGATANGIVSGAPANAGIVSSRNSHELHFGVGGASKMFINTSGNVGIGTTSIVNASAKLEVKGDIFITPVSSVASKLHLYNNDSTNETYIYDSGSSSNSILTFAPGGSTTMVVNSSNGFVGIGTTIPSGKLHVTVTETASQTNGFKVVGDTNSKAIVLGATSSYTWIQSHGSVPLRINELGNNVLIATGGSYVGIGTTSPLVRLDARSDTSYTSTLTQPAFFGTKDTTGPLGIVIQTISGSGNPLRTEITSTRYGVSGNDLSLNRDSGAGAGGLIVKYQGNVGVNEANPGYKLDVNGDSRLRDTVMVGSNIGLMQFAMDGARIFSYPNNVVHIKTSILKGNDTMIAFNLRGYYYGPQPIDTDVAFYLYNPVSYVYGVTIYHKAYNGFSVGMYYSTDNYVCLYIDGLSTYGGVVINWINTSLIQWGAKVTILGTSRVNSTAAQF